MADVERQNRYSLGRNSQHPDELSPREVAVGQHVAGPRQRKSRADRVHARRSRGVVLRVRDREEVVHEDHAAPPRVQSTGRGGREPDVGLAGERCRAREQELPGHSSLRENPRWPNDRDAGVGPPGFGHLERAVDEDRVALGAFEPEQVVDHLMDGKADSSAHMTGSAGHVERRDAHVKWSRVAMRCRRRRRHRATRTRITHAR